MLPKFKAKIINGKMEIHDKTRLQEYYRKFEGQDVSIVIDKWSSIRSLQQNKYLHGVVFKMIADETGYTLSEAKEQTKISVGFYKEIDFNDEKLLILKETSKLSKNEFMEFVEACRDWALITLNLNIPSPDNVDYDSLYYIDNC